MMSFKSRVSACGQQVFSHPLFAFALFAPQIPLCWWHDTPQKSCKTRPLSTSGVSGALPAAGEGRSQECSQFLWTSRRRKMETCECVCVYVYVCVSVCVSVRAWLAVCLPSFSVHKIYGNPSLWPSCSRLEIFLFFSFDSEKTCYN